MSTPRLGPVGVLVTATSAYSTDEFAEIKRRDVGLASSTTSWAPRSGPVGRSCRGCAEAGWGRIVNIAARSGLVGASRAAHYAAAKAGIVGLTVSLAKELGPSGILVNAVAPTRS